jgi:hypothetical protein
LFLFVPVDQRFDVRNKWMDFSGRSMFYFVRNAAGHSLNKRPIDPDLSIDVRPA